jgi:geranylgeranyl diphosphate synthase type I
MERRAPGEVTLDEVLAMAEARTGALLGCACSLGALYSGAAEEDVEAMDAFGRQAGLAFQLIDDVIGIWGDPVRTGTPAGADLAARKKSLPVVAALASGTPAAAELAELYEVPCREGDTEGVARTVLAVERAGGRDWAQIQAADRMARAMQELARAVPDPESAGGLLALAECVTRRSSCDEAADGSLPRTPEPTGVCGPDPARTTDGSGGGSRTSPRCAGPVLPNSPARVNLRTIRDG